MKKHIFLSENEKQICNEAFKKMGDQFSSREFGKAIRFLGLTDEFIENDKAYYFLKMNCRIIKGTRTWIKETAKSFWDDLREKNEKEPTIINAIDEALKLLIGTGKYKIYIKTEEYKEII